jgi:hypothetical protein
MKNEYTLKCLTGSDNKDDVKSASDDAVVGLLTIRMMIMMIIDNDNIDDDWEKKSNDFTLL